MIMSTLRLLRILLICLRYGLDELVLSGLKHPIASSLLKVVRLGRSFEQPRGERLRLALESLGPIFIKFGQVLSTRRDLIPLDIADELSALQDRVPPFPSEQAMESIQKAFGKHPSELFALFETEPVASASVAQVHFAVLHDGREAAVKVLRPGMLAVIERDLSLMNLFAGFVERLLPDGRRLRPREVVSEFDKYLHDELDLQVEAANCSQLRRNFESNPKRADLLIVPEVIWEFTSKTVMTMERMHGVPVSQIDKLEAAGVDIKKLARNGVEIFFTQVFEDGFFHADMHPGNIFVSLQPGTLGRYIALDFGIVGSLSEFDKNYLSQNFLAFFRRDYRRVAQLHIESGWVPATTREEELEAAVRSVCEPYFDRKLSEISLGQVLLRLFQTSRRFNVEIQPQLVLLQKTLLNVEGMGRQLDPDLDLWQTAKPFLERWMWDRIGPRAFIAQVRKEASQWSHLLPEIPRLVHTQLARQDSLPAIRKELSQLGKSHRRSERIFIVMTLILTLQAGLILWLVATLLEWQ